MVVECFHNLAVSFLKFAHENFLFGVLYVAGEM